MLILILLCGICGLADPTVLDCLSGSDTDSAIELIRKLGGRIKVEQVDKEKVVVEISLKGDRVDDSGLMAASRFRKLKRLYIWGPESRVTDVGLAALAQLKELRKLVLKGVSATDKGLSHVAQITT